MLEPSEREIKQFYLLLFFSFALTAVFSFLDQNTDLSKIVPPSNVVLSVTDFSDDQVWATSVRETGPPSVSKIEINSATLDELDACPGIGPVFAKSISIERAKGKFSSWEDLQNRVPGLGTYKIKIMQQAGVKLGR